MEVTVNSDDDNEDQTEDRDQTDVTIADENDLVDLAVFFKPSGVEGHLTITRSAKLRLWYRPDKAPAPEYNNEREVRRDWDLGGTVKPPNVIYVEGISVSDETADQWVGFQYHWGGATLTATQPVTVLPRNGESEVSLRVYQVTGTH
jgi:hypothetical protein